MQKGEKEAEEARLQQGRAEAAAKDGTAEEVRVRPRERPVALASRSSEKSLAVIDSSVAFLQFIVKRV